MKKIIEKLGQIYNKFKDTDKKKRAYIISIIVIIFIMAWAFISAGVITSNFNRAQIKSIQDEQKVDAHGIIITETKNGKKYFEIYGETGNYSNEGGIATLNNVIGNFYKDNEVAMSFQSSKGAYDERQGTITLYDNTYIVLKDDVSLNTDKLTWYGNDKDTVAEGHVVIKKSNEMISTAEKGIIRAGYEHFKIIGNTQTNVYEKKK